MKIAFVNQPLDYIAPQYQSSSIGLWNDALMRSLADRDASFIVYARRFPEQPPFEKHGRVQYRRVWARLDEAIARSASVIERLLNYPRPRQPFFTSRWNFYFYGRAIARDLQRQNPDIIHIHNYSQLVAPIRELNPHARIVLHMHHPWLTQIHPSLVEPRLAQVDRIAGCSDFLTQSIQEAFPAYAGRCQAMYHGVDTEWFHAADPALPAPTRDRKKLLFVGRFSPEKGLHILLQAFQMALSEVPDAHLDLIGAPGDAPYETLLLAGQEPGVGPLKTFYHGRMRRGSYYAELQNGVSDELARKVRFIGYVPHRELVKHYNAAGALVNPSLRESFGISLIEAMACELPVVATRVGGMAEVVTNGQTGLSVPPDDANALAEAIVRILKEEDLRQFLGAAGRRLVLERYSWERVSSMVWNQYQSFDRKN